MKPRKMLSELTPDIIATIETGEVSQPEVEAHLFRLLDGLIEPANPVLEALSDAAIRYAVSHFVGKLFDPDYRAKVAAKMQERVNEARERLKARMGKAD